MAAIPNRNSQVPFVVAHDHEPYPAWMEEYRWDADSAAERATLVVSHDAQTQTIDLTPNLYAGASLLLPQQSPDLDVVLRTERGGKAISEVRTRVVALDPSSHPAKVRPPDSLLLRKRRRRN